MKWQQISSALWVATDNNVEIGTIWKDKMCYTAHYLKEKQTMVKDYFISFKSARTWTDNKLTEQGYKETEL